MDQMDDLTTKPQMESEAEPIASTSPKVRYAVVGLGYISQVAVLPAFKRAQENSELVALVSGDAAKLKKLTAPARILIS